MNDLDVEICRLQEEIKSVRTENERLLQQLKIAIWSDSEHCKLLEADNERLRAALRIIAGQEQCIDNLMSNADIAREALTEGNGR